MNLEFPLDVTWYIRAEFTSLKPLNGSAVAVRLRHPKEPEDAGKNYFLTCRHVVESDEGGSGKANAGKIKLWPPGVNMDYPPVPAKIHPLDTGLADWVLLEPEVSVNTYNSAVSWHDVSTEPLKCQISGYPGGSAAFQPNDWSSKPVVRPIIHEVKGIYSSNDQRIVLTGSGTARGMSGGAVVDDKNRLLGIHQASLGGAVQTWLVPIKSIRDRLAESQLIPAVVSSAPSWLTAYRAHLARALDSHDKFRSYTPVFDYHVTPKSAEPNRGRMSPQSFCDIVAEKKYGGLIVGNAGTGKSGSLGRMARHLLERDLFVPVVIEAGRLDGQRLKECVRDQFKGLELHKAELEAVLANGQIRDSDKTGKKTLRELRNILGSRRLFFLIDGINEVNPSDEAKVLKLLVDYIESNGESNDVCIITTRSNPSVFQDWEVATIDKLDKSTIHAALKSNFSKVANDEKMINILELPFFLHLATTTKTFKFVSRASLIQNYFQKKGNGALGITDDAELIDAGRTALELYRANNSTHFKMKSLTDSFPTAETVLEGALSHFNDGTAAFSHQLLHDFLIAFYFVNARMIKDPKTELWHPENLDAATFHGENRDPLMLAVELLEPTKTTDARNDDFLSCVYNWNTQGTIASLKAGAGDGSDRKFSRDLQTAILALLADKQFDAMLHTVRDFDSNRLNIKAVPEGCFDEEEKAFFLAKDRAELRALVQNRSMSEAYSQWKSIFTLAMTETLRENIFRVTGNDPVLAWTIANSLRDRTIQKPEDAGVLVGLLHSMVGARPLVDPSNPGKRTSQDIARWRVVFALGSFAGHEYVRAALMERLRDENEYVWVRYGAGRALVEVAAQSDVGNRASIVNQLQTFLGELASFKDRPKDLNNRVRIMREIGRSTLYRKCSRPDEWIKSVKGLVDVTTRFVDQFDDFPGRKERWQTEVVEEFTLGGWIRDGEPLKRE